MIYWYSFFILSLRLLQFQTDQPCCHKIHILRTSKTMFEEILPVKQIILSPLIPYFQQKLAVNCAGNL